MVPVGPGNLERVGGGTGLDGDVKICVSADGKARLLRIEGAKSGTLEFSEWDSVAPTSAPPVDQRAQTPNL
jgi:hypothetical protein